jgi:hypothetical protein
LAIHLRIGMAYGFTTTCDWKVSMLTLKQAAKLFGPA